MKRKNYYLEEYDITSPDAGLFAVAEALMHVADAIDRQYENVPVDHALASIAEAVSGVATALEIREESEDR